MSVENDTWHRLQASARRRLQAGACEEAEADLRKAAALAEKFPAGDPRRAKAWFQLAECLCARPSGRAEGMDAYRRATAEFEKLYGPSHPAVARVLCAWGAAWFAAGRADDLLQAVPLWERAITIFQADSQETRADLRRALRNLARARFEAQGNASGALPLLRRALSLAGNADALETLDDRELLSRILEAQGRRDEAGGALREWAAAAEKLAEEDPARAGEALRRAADRSLERGELREAETFCLRALSLDARARRLVREEGEGGEVGTIRDISGHGLFHSFVETLMEEGVPAQAFPETLSELLAAVERGECGWKPLDTLWQVYAAQGRRATAESVLDPVLALARNEGHAAASALPRLLRAKGQLRAEAGDFEGAEALLREAVEACGRAGEGEELPRALLGLGRLLVERGRASDARPWLERALSAASDEVLAAEAKALMKP